MLIFTPLCSKSRVDLSAVRARCKTNAARDNINPDACTTFLRRFRFTRPIRPFSAVFFDYSARGRRGPTDDAGGSFVLLPEIDDSPDRFRKGAKVSGGSVRRDRYVRHLLAVVSADHCFTVRPARSLGPASNRLVPRPLRPPISDSRCRRFRERKIKTLGVRRCGKIIIGTTYY